MPIIATAVILVVEPHTSADLEAMFDELLNIRVVTIIVDLIVDLRLIIILVKVVNAGDGVALTGAENPNQG